MAEIKIEKKKPIWPWIVAVLLISAIIYFVFLRDNEAQTEDRVEIENNTSANSTN
jgi:preprotein translocase subunit YajC